MKYLVIVWLSLVFRLSLVSSFAIATNTLQRQSSQIGAHSLTVSYEGRKCKVRVKEGETILDALERSGARQDLCLPDLPSDCRRGNCLTCCATHVGDSERKALVSGENGLSPYVSNMVSSEGYVLTCSSYLSGDGVMLELGGNDQVWNDVYRQRHDRDDVQISARAAMAKTIRGYAERNVPDWKQETEEVYRQSGTA